MYSSVMKRECSSFSLPSSLTMSVDDAHGVKQNEKRLTLLLTASWMREKEKPLKIWKGENPHVLKGPTRANSRWRTSAKEKPV